ncbi:MAG: TonB-dependent receptor [Leeuwenhoekiella sp.]
MVISVGSVMGQEISVIDAQRQQPILGVNIYNEDRSKSEVTNLDGQANISKFTKSETLIFSYVGFETKRTTKAAIVSDNFVVRLRENQSNLNEVVVSVAKFEQQSDAIAQNVVSLTAKDIAFNNPQTAADLLENSGQVYVQKSQLGGGSPMIRGFSTNRLLITVDGVRMNTAIFRAGNVQNVINIDPFTVTSTEVILGPGSVVYGSDAVGGVMNFYTKKPVFSFREGLDVSGAATARFASANNEQTGHFDINVGTERWAFLSSLSYSDYGDLRMGSHGPDDYLRPEYVIRNNDQDVVIPNEDPRVQRPTGFDSYSLMQRVRFMPNALWDFNLGLTYSTTSDYPRYDRLVRERNGQLRSAEWFYGPQSWLLANFQIDKKGSGFWYDKFKVNVAYQNFQESRNDRDFGEALLYVTQENVNAYSLNVDLTKKWGKHHFYYGAEYLLNTIGSSGQIKNINTGSTQPDASRYPDGSSWQSIAGYFNGQIQLNETLNLMSGLRYNHVLINASFDSRFYDFPFEEADLSTGNLTGAAGLNWQPNEIVGYKLNLSTAFRAPNIDDIGKVFDSSPGNVVVPNPNLKAEYAYNADLGTTLGLRDWLTLDVAVYYTHLENALVRRNYSLNGQTIINYQGEPSRVQAIQNAASAEVYGLEAGVQMRINPNLLLKSQINIMEGTQEEDDGSTAPLRHAAPLFGNTHLIWEKRRLKIDAFAEYNGKFDFEDLAPSQQENAFLYALDENGNPYSPAWYTLNLTAAYDITTDVKTTLSVENITDQRYRQYSSGISAPGRNLILSLRYLF